MNPSVSPYSSYSAPGTTACNRSLCSRRSGAPTEQNICSERGVAR